MKIANRIRKATVVAITLIAFMYVLLWVLSLDSQTGEQLLNGGIISCICGIWIASFLYANCEGEE